jgi:hypothetical protein
VTIANTVLLSSSETAVDTGIISGKTTYLNEPYVRKPLMRPISQRNEELRL